MRDYTVCGLSGQIYSAAGKRLSGVGELREGEHAASLVELYFS